MVDFEAEALRDGEQAARERHQAQVEMEQGLIAQEQALERGTGSPIVEQADGTDNATSDGENVITATHEGGAGNTDATASGATIGSPGAGTDPSETQTSSGEQTTSSTLDDGPDGKRNVELQGDERMFEGEEGTRPLSEQ